MLTAVAALCSAIYLKYEFSLQYFLITPHIQDEREWENREQK
jgi:hypothetical protein